jgi:thiamine biosynthesis protein ThiS
MPITINGQTRTDIPTTVAELLDILKLDADRVAVEHNREILPREKFARQPLADGDTLEIVQFVGGG